MVRRLQFAARQRRRRRVRAKIFGTAVRPRLSVFRSNKYIVVQLIDDAAGKTLTAASDLSLKFSPAEGRPTKTSRSFAVGEALAKQALQKRIKRVVFDRGGYKYHGRVRALAEGARQGGLSF